MKHHRPQLGRMVSITYIGNVTLGEVVIQLSIRSNWPVSYTEPGAPCGVK